LSAIDTFKALTEPVMDWTVCNICTSCVNDRDDKVLAICSICGDNYIINTKPPKWEWNGKK
jgi:hypothetical protein